MSPKLKRRTIFNYFGEQLKRRAPSCFQFIFCIECGSETRSCDLTSMAWQNETNQCVDTHGHNVNGGCSSSRNKLWVLQIAS